MSKGNKHSHCVAKEKVDSSVSEDVMNNPEILASLQDEVGLRLKAMKEYELLPAMIKKRVRALKHFQMETIKIEESFFKELSLLEAKFSDIYQTVYNKRNEIITGTREPTESEEECESEHENELIEDIEKVAITSGDQKVDDDSVKGIPEFWLRVLRNSELIRYNIQEHDVAVLKHLVDIKCVLKTGDEHGFTLEFYFSKNEFFTDDKLTKEYFVHVGASNDSPFEYEGPEIVRTAGCNIHWLPGKNMTVKLVKKIQKCKNRAEKRTVTKVVKNDSFFNFFEPPTDSLNGDDDISPEIESLLEADFEMGQYIRERLIPRAVLYFTGEGVEEEDDDEDDEDDDEEDSDDDSEAYQRPNSKQVAGAPGDDKPDCKQQ